ncbi:50S ribosomal protein L18 [Parasulfuritortus cantonensis]|uniref:Large ribosomal subunit protein uL18 n=1 Tax=Parasulfuritortus cantonensis TaxID=2528202 RepID=A0A4R1B8C5_9PROT|nr:50S ribosomal protein L18 [Parasulfuritortus cantonensis]TCJ12353.1 50S ribosomal protein L18 [Parasulfuritortus cantonensis]
MDKKIRRLRRARKTRAKIAELGVARLCIYRSNCHIYAQVIDATGGTVVCSASTQEKELRDQVKNGGNAEAAKLVGQRIAEKAKAAGVEQVAFDRSGFIYHGRVKALAEAARENGLRF